MTGLMDTPMCPACGYSNMDLAGQWLVCPRCKHREDTACQCPRCAPPGGSLPHTEWDTCLLCGRPYAARGWFCSPNCENPDAVDLTARWEGVKCP